MFSSDIFNLKVTTPPTPAANLEGVFSQKALIISAPEGAKTFSFLFKNTSTPLWIVTLFVFSL